MKTVFMPLNLTFKGGFLQSTNFTRCFSVTRWKTRDYCEKQPWEKKKTAKASTKKFSTNFRSPGFELLTFESFPLLMYKDRKYN